MALSGVYEKSFHNGKYRLRVEWEASQNYSDNKSTITSKVYMQSDSTWSMYIGSRTGSYNVDGQTGTFSGNSISSGGGKKVYLGTFSRTVNHNSDGTKSLSMSVSYPFQVTISGTYYGTITANSGTVTLNTIPRSSTITSDVDWTAPNNFTLNISRASSSFTHTVRIYVRDSGGIDRLVKTINDVGTSVNSYFTPEQNTDIFEYLAQRNVATSKVEVDTISNGSKIGDTAIKYGNCIASKASTVNSGVANFEIGDLVEATISRSHSLFTHTLRFIVGGELIGTLTGAENSAVFSPSSYQTIQMFELTPNSNSIDSRVEIDTFYGGIQVRGTTSRTGTATVTNSDPTFGANFYYEDTNATTLALTGNNQYIVQGVSRVYVTLPSGAKAEAINGANMAEYVATLFGMNQTATYSETEDIVFDFGIVDAKRDTTVTITAIDSRGNSTSNTIDVTILPYSYPVVNASARRANGFEEQTTLSLSGSISPLNVNGADKNSLQKVEYRYKSSATSLWGSWTSFVYSTTYENYTASDVILNLDNVQSYDVEFRTTDKLGSVTVYREVSKGVPIMFIDAQKRSLGIGQFPQNNDSLEVKGNIYFEGEIFKNGEPLETGLNPSEGLSFNSDVARVLDITTTDNDVDIFRVGNSGSGYGYYQKYTGTGSANDNNLELWTEGQIGTDVLAMKVWQDGTVLFPKGINVEDEGGKHRTVLKGIGDDVNNYGIATLLQGGGQTIIGGGEGGANWFAGEGDPANEHIILASDHDTKIATDMQSGYASRREWIFARNGYLYHPRYKMPNGYNMNTIRDSSGSHDDLLLIQNVVGTASFSGESFTFVDVSFPATFNSAPLWIVATAINSSSYGYNAAVYNPSTSGCRVYLRHIQDASITGTIQVQVVACGKRA